MSGNNKGILGTIYNVYNKSNARNPIKTGNFIVDSVVGRNKYIKAWNVGFEAGKAGFVSRQSYKELKQNKKK